jgi:hypothetical protein
LTSRSLAQAGSERSGSCRELEEEVSSGEREEEGGDNDPG